MKNEKYKRAMKNLSPDYKTKERMMNKIMKQKDEKKTPILGPGKALASVALFALVIMVMITLWTGSDDNVLYSDNNVTISVAEDVPDIEQNPASSTAIYQADEVFNLFPIDGFRGEVKETQNIVIEDRFGKTYLSYLVVVANEVYQGEISIGEEVKILLPGPIKEGKIMGADFNITRAYLPGEEGIFLPVINDDSSSNVIGFSKYSLPETTQFSFVMTGEGLDFNKKTFSELEEADSLDEVEEYVKEKLTP